MRYLTLAVFPLYSVHQTLIVVLAHHLARLGLPQGLEVAILIVATIAGCFVTYEIARRLPMVCWLFGLKSQPRSVASRPPPSA